MRSKTPYILLIIVLILVIIGLVGWYFLARPKTPVPASPTSTTTAPVANSLPITDVAPLHITDSGTYYTADLEYPPTTPLAQSVGASADAAAVATMKAYDENAIATFKKDSDIADITPQAAQDEGLNSYNKYSLTSTYKVYTSPTSVSYVFTISEDTLGAHPNSSFQTFTFRAKDGVSISLANLFDSGTNYLSSLSILSRTALTKQLGSGSSPSFIDPGTTADANNFSNFAIDGSNLLIFIPPYAVEPYSSGSQTVSIPLTQLSNVLQAAYQ